MNMQEQAPCGPRERGLQRLINTSVDMILHGEIANCVNFKVELSSFEGA